MPTYVLLTRLTTRGRKTLYEKPDRLAHVNLEIKDYGYTVLAQYATIGPYDFLTVVEAPDNEAVARLSAGLASRGTVEITSMPVVSVEDLIQRMTAPDDLGRKVPGQHARFFDKETGTWRP